MVSHSSHTRHGFLILVIRVTNIRISIETFVTYEKGLIMLHMKRIFQFFTILVIFLFFNIAHLLQVMRSSIKNRSRNCDQNPQKYP